MGGSRRASDGSDSKRKRGSWASREPWTAQQCWLVTDGFRARYCFFCDGASYISNLLVSIESKDRLGARSANAAAAGKRGWTKWSVPHTKHYGLVEAPKNVQVEAVQTRQ